VDIDSDSLSQAELRLDRVIGMDLDHPNFDMLDRAYDIVVMGDVLEHLRDPAHLLGFARQLITDHGRLVCCIPNMCHASVLERFLAGDVCYDEVGLLDSTHIRFLSSGSVFKMLLDSGWLPEIRDSYTVGHPDANYVEQLLSSAETLGLSRAITLKNVLTYQYIIDCLPRLPPPRTSTELSFTVVVPVNRRRQFGLNVERSPGLAEVGAQILAVEGAANAAEALERGRQSAANEWIVYCHQDVYFPAGTGFMICDELARITEADKPGALLGFAGMAYDDTGTPRHTGLMIDRIHRFDHPRSDSAISLDEFAVILHRDSNYQIDPRFGWHLWATDLCVQGLVQFGRYVARTLRVPLFHNSWTDYSVPPAFKISADQLVWKYPQFSRFPTLCMDIWSAK